MANYLLDMLSVMMNALCDTWSTNEVEEGTGEGGAGEDEAGER